MSRPVPTDSPVPRPTTPPPASETSTEPQTASPPAPASAEPFDAAAAMATIEHLASIGPREATGPAFDQASDWVVAQLEELGYSIDIQEFEAPAGTSWGVAVDAGTSHNVIASPPDFDDTGPHLLVGAHLDTVPQSPGAEDNASGIAVMLQLARMVSQQPAELPVRFIAFGAEEPRGEGDGWHHFGSRHYVAELDEAERGAITAMVSLDRVGVPGDAVPISSGGTGTNAVRDELVAAAGEIPTVADTNRASDHWSFEKASIPAARLGSISFSGYHSPADTPDVVDAGQLAAVGQIMWSWLQAQPA